MNKTLLLIICDFLLLNLLALTRWEKLPENPPPARSQPQPVDTVKQTVEEDLVGALRTSLEEAQKARAALREQLEAAQGSLSEREETLAEREKRLAALRENLAQKEKEARQLSERVADTQSAISQLTDRLSEATQQAASSRAQSEQLARELAERQAAAQRLQEQVQQMEQDRARAQERIQSLTTQVQVAETERGYLRQNVETLRTQVTAEREEKARLQEQTGKLAEGVTQIAQATGSLRQEIRSNTPVNANTLFNDFLVNRIDAVFHAERDSFFGRVTGAPPPTKAILVTDGEGIYALFHTRNTIMAEGSADWRAIDGMVRSTRKQIPIERMQILAADPRVAVVPIEPAAADALGVKVYPTALEPFKFPEAVLITQAGKYGEVEFKLDPSTPGYVRMKNRIFSGLFGEFSPSAGDLVFSKTGEVLGVMVNGDYCVLVDSFRAVAELPFGQDLLDQHTGTVIAQQRERITRLPLRLQ